MLQTNHAYLKLRDFLSKIPYIVCVTIPTAQVKSRDEDTIMLKKNVGTVDRVIRAIIGIVLVAAYFMYPDMAYKLVALIVGLILLATAVLSSCPLYSIIGIKTCKSDG